MSLKKRYNRINHITKQWKLQKTHSLITRYKINSKFFNQFKFNIKLYISKALNIDFSINDKIFLKNIDKARNNRINITPNGAIVPKREYHLEYNLVLRSWCELVSQMSKNNPKLLKLFRITPKIRIMSLKSRNLLKIFCPTLYLVLIRCQGLIYILLLILVSQNNRLRRILCKNIHSDIDNLWILKKKYFLSNQNQESFF